MTLAISLNDLQMLWQGLQATVTLAVVASIATLTLGIGVAMFRFLMPPSIAWVGTLYVDSIRSMPLVLYLVLIFTILPVPPFQRAVFALATFNAAFIAEVIRSAVNSLDKNQFRAAYLLGMSDTDVFLHVALPQSMARMIPAFINQMNTLLKDTSLVSLGALELSKAGEILMERSTDQAFQYIMILAAIYFTLCLLLSLLGQRLEKIMRPWHKPLYLA